MTTSKIVRFYQYDDSDDEVTATGLTLEQAHCHGPQTTSTTTGPPKQSPPSGDLIRRMNR